MRLWVDDIRPAPDGWVTAKTSDHAITVLKNILDVDEISLDHDLGGDDTTRPIVLWMCENNRFPPTIRVHSSNPPGVEWIEGMINRYGPGVTK